MLVEFQFKHPATGCFQRRWAVIARAFVQPKFSVWVCAQYAEWNEAADFHDELKSPYDLCLESSVCRLDKVTEVRRIVASDELCLDLAGLGLPTASTSRVLEYSMPADDPHLLNMRVVGIAQCLPTVKKAPRSQAMSSELKDLRMGLGGRHSAEQRQLPTVV